MHVFLEFPLVAHFLLALVLAHEFKKGKRQEPTSDLGSLAFAYMDVSRYRCVALWLSRIRQIRERSCVRLNKEWINF